MREGNFLSIERCHFDSRNIANDRFALLLIGNPLYRENADILNENIGGRSAITVTPSRVKHVNVIAREDEAADAHHLIDADCHGTHTGTDDCGEGGPGTGA